MNRVVAYQILAARFHALESQTAEVLCAQLGRCPTETLLGEDGIEYIIDLEIRWDSKEKGVLSIFGTARDNNTFKFDLLEERMKIHLTNPHKTNPSS